MLGELSNITATSPAISRSDPAASRPAEQSASATPASEDSQAQASPRIQVDPVAGVILQFLDPQGEVETQTPSFAAVAYLRAGLTGEGFRKEDPDSSSFQMTA
ncbi:MAG: hypothetical protein WDO70_07440 [Alphaproteobacteria bacterium]